MITIPITLVVPTRYCTPAEKRGGGRQVCYKGAIRKGWEARPHKHLACINQSSSSHIHNTGGTCTNNNQELNFKPHLAKSREKRDAS